MREQATAAVPILIALAGGAVLGAGDVERLRMRVARPSVPHLQSELANAVPLTDQQQMWLEEQNPFGVPEIGLPGHRTLIVREGYSLEHNNIDLIADWVAFRLTTAFVNGTEPRPGSSAFKPDPLLPAGRRAERDDYSGWRNVYDRGHQAANADQRGRGVAVVRESFLLSNMTPQASRLNQNRWRILEGRIQELARSRGELWVVTGPVFVDEDSDGVVHHYVLGQNRVAVPTHYFKIVVAEREDVPGEFEIMAFLVGNEPLEGEFADHLVSVDRIEELTGYDFLPELPDEESLEAEIPTELLSGGS